MGKKYTQAEKNRMETVINKLYYVHATTDVFKHYPGIADKVMKILEEAINR